MAEVIRKADASEAGESASLDTLQPGRQVKLSTGEVLNVQPFLWGHLAEVTRQLVLFGIAFENLDLTQLSVVMNVVARYPDAAYNLIAIDLERGEDWEKAWPERAIWVKQLSAIDGLRLAVAVVKENESFFDQAKEIIGEAYPDALAKFWKDQPSSAAEPTGTT